MNREASKRHTARRPDAPLSMDGQDEAKLGQLEALERMMQVSKRSPGGLVAGCVMVVVGKHVFFSQTLPQV